MIQNKNKGFTLIELLSVIVVFVIIMLIVSPVVINIIKSANKGAFKNSVNGIVKSAILEQSKNVLTGKEVNELIFTYENGVEKSNIIGAKLNYKGKSPSEGVIIVNKKGQVSLALFDSMCAIKSFEGNVEIKPNSKEDCQLKLLIPTIELIGNNTIDIEINTKYEELGVIAKKYNGDVIKNVDIKIKYNGIIQKTVDTSKLGTYELIYSVQEDNQRVEILRIIHIVDTIPPVLNIPKDIVIDIKNFNDFDFMDGVSATDNSNEKINIITTSNIVPIPGNYYIKYEAFDSSGNKTEKIRQINIIDTTPPNINKLVISTKNVTSNSFVIIMEGEVFDEHSDLAQKPFIYQTSTDNVNWQTKCTTSNKDCLVENLNNNTTYYYRLCVIDIYDNKACSNNKSITTSNPLYYYDKYRVGINYYNYRNPSSNFSYSYTTSEKSLSSGSTISIAGTTSYGFNSTSGFYGTGSSVTLTQSTISNGYTRYYASGSSISQHKIVNKRTSGSTVYWKEEVYVMSCQYDTSYTRGAFIETVTAITGQYPNNGRHTDGYWYVRRELVS